MFSKCSQQIVRGQHARQPVAGARAFKSAIAAVSEDIMCIIPNEIEQLLFSRYFPCSCDTSR